MASLKKIGDKYYILYYQGKKQKCQRTGTGTLQIAKDLLGQFEAAQLRGLPNPLPTQTPLADVLEDYVQHLFTVKRDKNAQKDVSYLRAVFGSICAGLKVKNEKIAAKAAELKAIKREAVKHKTVKLKGAKCTAIKEPSPLEYRYFEDVTTPAIAQFIAGMVRSRGIKGKTANRYREILTRLYNWATSQHGIRLPGEVNPAAKVERYAEDELDITFLTLDQIDVQLESLRAVSLLRVMVAVYIYAGLRREEALWLTRGDIDLATGKYGIIRVRTKTVNDVLWRPKTGKNRIVPISSNLRRFLDQYTPAASADGWYFPSPCATRWDPDNFSSDLSVANKSVDLDWTCGDYRHTFGSHLAMKGESLFKISRLMGNSPKICEKHYAALTPESLHGSVEFPDNVARPEQPGADAADLADTAEFADKAEKVVGGSGTASEEFSEPVRPRPQLRLVVSR